ncbi:MAG TPA: inorganic diphosphatase [Vicinamibacterales bacterium]|nr:inorganic diphosphatase [Vicinamibacterales bacterium]
MPLIVALLIVALQMSSSPPEVLPATATSKLRASLKAASAHTKHAWRDTAPFEAELVKAIVEIPRGDRRKFEFDMAKNTPAVDRVMPKHIGGYPVNYGIVPQTISYDGDPFDVLVLGPAVPSGRLVTGVIVGLMQMEDETGLDSKVVLSRVGKNGKPLHQLTDAEKKRIADYFNRYKKDDDDPKTFATVPGWGTAAEGLAFVRMTHAFFQECEPRAGAVCHVVR